MLVKYSTKEKELLARIMRAEALGEGDLGMLMVGNVVVNRAIANCLNFKNTRTINDVIFQNPGGFTGVNSPLFIGYPTAKEQGLAERVLRGEYYYPATHALWFYSPKEDAPCVGYWYEQKNSGRFKKHCFYRPYPGVCPNLY